MLHSAISQIKALTKPEKEPVFGLGPVLEDKKQEMDLNRDIRASVITNLFYKIFEVVYCDTPALKEKAHRLRYKVFCEEHDGYEDPNAFPDQQEKDAYDEHADQAMLIYKATGEAFGTVRIIKAKKDDWQNSFPLQNVCESDQLRNELFVKNACEFSRLCISKEMRLKVKEDLKSLTNTFNNTFTFYERPLLTVALSLAPLALCHAGFEMAMRNGCLNMFGIMEPRVINRFKRSGLVLTPMGEAIEYHGTRQPFICNVLEILEQSIANSFEAWTILTHNGQTHRNAINMNEKKGYIEH